MTGVLDGRGGSDFVEGRQLSHLVGDVAVGTEGAVTPMPGRDGEGAWLVTGYRQTRELLRDRRFSRAVLAESGHCRGPATRMSITEMDPPRHTRIRTLIGGAFSARRAEQLRPHVEEIAARLLERLVAEGPTADLLRDYCAPLTFAAQCELLGVPASRRAAVHRRANDRLGTAGEDAAATYRSELRLHEEIIQLLADRVDPPTALLADLLTAHRDHQLISENELTGLAASLFFDGHALAAAQIANAVLCVISRPGLLPRLRAQPALLDGVVEESLRYSPSVNFSMTRIATSDVDLDGVRIHAGDRVTAALPLANRDDTEFAEASRFGAERTGRKHLAFGHGTHHCLGAHLARVEIRVALSTLSHAAPELHLAVAEQDLSWSVSAPMRTLNELPVRWSPRT